MKTHVAGDPEINGLFKACIIVFVICMIMAARGANTDIIGILLEAGADQNVMDNNNNTCMHMAAMGNRPEVIAYLLEKDKPEHE